MKRSERKPSVGETNSSNSDAAGVDTHTPVQPQDLGKANCERPNAKIKRLVSNMSNATGESFQSSFQGSVDAEKTRRVSRMLEQCEAVGWPFRKKLILANLNLSFVDIPIEGICSEKIGPFLYKLSLRGNSIFVVPHSLVTRLMGLKTLDLSNCGLEELPDVWDLPSLKKLCLGRNKLTTFPSDGLFRGSPMLENLDMYENGLTELRLPNELALLSRLEHLNLNYNLIATIPAYDLSMLRALKTFKIMSNCITIVPELVCEMDLRVLDVMSNPLIQPPLETCARGLSSMRRYYTCLRVEEGSERSNPKRFLRATARKMKAFPQSLCRSIRSVSDSSNISEIALMSRTGSLEGTVTTDETQEVLVGLDEANKKTGEIAINDTLKVVFVGMALSGKTSIIKRLIEGESARMPSLDDRTVGVDIYPWRPSEKCDNETSNVKNDPSKSIFEAPLNTQIEVNENLQSRLKAPLDVKFSMWDFAGQDCYHATHELFFSSRALYVLVWDMAANNPQTVWRRTSLTLSEEEQGEFNLLDSSDEEDEDNYLFDSVEKRRSIRALEKDIDDKVNFWVETIQASAPGAAILPVASFDDYFSEQEATMRCKIMKDRLLRKEMTRIEGMKQRLDKFHSSQEGDSREAMLVEKLLSPWNRPKLIFGINGDDVIRVSSETGSGFDSLAAGIVNVATGRETGQWPYPVFHGHIGARIPCLWLEVRNLVRKMRERFKVVESGYFLNELMAKGIDNPDDISDALHFLTNIGELSYFGERRNPHDNHHDLIESSTSISVARQSSYGDDLKSVSSSTPRHQSSSSSVETKSSSFGFDDFIFLNPRWLVAAIACILRHDLTREIYEVRRLIAETKGSIQEVKADELSDVVDTDLNYPVISSRDVFLLWQTKRFTQKAAVKALQYSNNDKVTPFDFLQKILVRFSVFVPVDLTCDRACLGGKDFTHFNANGIDSYEDGHAKFFFIPSLLGPEEPKDAWTFKSVDSWKTTLCHTIVFPDGSPPGLMERLTGSILNDFNTTSASASDGITDTSLRLKETLCWRSAFLLRIAVDVIDGGTVAESIVDIFVTLVDQESVYCVASDSMSVGMRKLIISARGQSGDYGSKIWKGGYMRVILMTTSFLCNEYSGLEFECQIACPQCLSCRPIAQCSVWNPPTLFTLAEKDSLIRCRYGHGVDIRLLTALQGQFKNIAIKPSTTSFSYLKDSNEADTVPISKILKSVVFVGVWDEVSQRIFHTGSGFFVDHKRGFIVTAGHILLDSTWRETRAGKIVIGVIPSDSENVCCFRYFARIISKDPSIKENGFCTVDACVLQLLSRMESDVFHNGKEIGEQPEMLLMNNPDAMKREKLTSLSVTEKVELDETIRILGFNQGGEGLIEPGSEVHRSADFARGYVVMRFAASEISEQAVSKSFQPRSEIVVICPTIGGHSGGPCINQQGEVIGILSRVDPTDKQRCYLVPSSEFNPLVKEAKRVLVYGL